MSLQGDLDLPVLKINIKLHTPLTREIALNLRDQINVMFPDTEHER